VRLLYNIRLSILGIIGTIIGISLLANYFSDPGDSGLLILGIVCLLFSIGYFLIVRSNAKKNKRKE
jgi:hypothetical protein